MSTRQCPTEQLWRGGEEAGTGTIIVGYAKTKQALNKKKILNKGTLFLTKPKTTMTTAMCGRQNHQSGSLSCVICTDHDGFYLMSHGHEEVQFVLRSSYLGPGGLLPFGDGPWVSAEFGHIVFGVGWWGVLRSS